MLMNSKAYELTGRWGTDLLQATGPLVLRALCRRHLWAGRATEGAGREPRLLAEEHGAAGVGNQRCLRGGRSGRRSEPSLPAGGGREASGVQEWHDGTTGRQKRWKKKQFWERRTAAQI
jgi:polygalacturonase